MPRVRYNELAVPQLRRAGIGVVDTYRSGLAHPELSLDGVHFPGALSRSHAELFLRRGPCRDSRGRETRQQARAAVAPPRESWCC